MKGRSSGNRGGEPASFFNLSLSNREDTKTIGELRETSPSFWALVLTESTERTDFARAVEAGIASVLQRLRTPASLVVPSMG